MKPVGVMVVSQEEVDEARQAYQQSCLQGADDKLGQFLDQDIEACGLSQKCFAILFEKLLISGFT